MLDEKAPLSGVYSYGSVSDFEDDDVLAPISGTYHQRRTRYRLFVIGTFAIAVLLVVSGGSMRNVFSNRGHDSSFAAGNMDCSYSGTCIANDMIASSENGDFKAKYDSQGNMQIIKKPSSFSGTDEICWAQPAMSFCTKPVGDVIWFYPTVSSTILGDAKPILKFEPTLYDKCEIGEDIPAKFIIIKQKTSLNEPDQVLNTIPLSTVNCDCKGYYFILSNTGVLSFSPGNTACASGVVFNSLNYGTTVPITAPKKSNSVSTMKPKKKNNKKKNNKKKNKKNKNRKNKRRNKNKKPTTVTEEERESERENENEIIENSEHEEEILNEESERESERDNRIIENKVSSEKEIISEERNEGQEKVTEKTDEEKEIER